MFFHRRRLTPLADRGPLRVMFITTSLPVGGMERLLVELIRRLDRTRVLPELCCLKRFDALGQVLAEEVPAFSGLLKSKYDVAVLRRLTRLLRERRIDAVVTVGAGDKMFWGRLAAAWAGVPVVCSALHSTGEPDRVELLNRQLARLTDAFIGVAGPQARWLIEREDCPAEKVVVIPNGVDPERFHPRWPDALLREALGLPEHAPIVGIVAALRPEKDHELFLRVAARVQRDFPAAKFLVVGDGPERANLENLSRASGLEDAVLFLGTREDIPEILSLVDVVVLTSRREANPVSLLEAMAGEKPVVATRVGSVAETVLDGRTGYLADAGDAEALARGIGELLAHPDRAAAFGRAGREQVLMYGSLEGMVRGYEDLIVGIYEAKTRRRRRQGEWGNRKTGNWNSGTFADSAAKPGP
ncbi:MAG: glycosyltransferase [Pirellulales bacterium]|nr:glycosyltransferase [Pirellulales bacterium]